MYSNRIEERLTLTLKFTKVNLSQSSQFDVVPEDECPDKFFFLKLLDHFDVFLLENNLSVCQITFCMSH